jgi:SAM-dependent methyltransferase
MTKPHYTTEFFDTIRDGSRRSAEVVVPIVLELLKSKSVIDVGCGDGTWLSVFRELGVNDVCGLDGEYVDVTQLRIPRDLFNATDLSSPFEAARKFDLAMSLEVAEHLPSPSAKGFVESLTRLAPLILFSAAIPLQGGTNHLNEQWPEYWAELFKNHDYVPIDFIRGRIWSNPQVEWYYAQNTLLFAHAERLKENEELSGLYRQTNLQQLSLVHPKRFLQPFQCGVRSALRLLGQAAKVAFQRRLGIGSR